VLVLYIYIVSLTYLCFIYFIHYIIVTSTKIYKAFLVLFFIDIYKKMETRRTILLGSRHGRKQAGKGRSNLLKPSSLSRLHDVTGGFLQPFVQEYSVKPNQAFAKHSKEKRTRTTANAILLGAFGLELPKGIDGRPKNSLIYLATDGSAGDIEFDSTLCYGKLGEDFLFDLDAYNADGNATYMRNWFANPDSGVYTGPSSNSVQVTLFSDVVKRSRGSLARNLGILLNQSNDKTIGVLGSHGGIVEALTVAAVNTGRHAPVEHISDIGGDYSEEEFFHIEVDQSRSGTVQGVKLVRGNQSYKMDIGNLSL